MRWEKINHIHIAFFGRANAIGKAQLKWFLYRETFPLCKYLRICDIWEIDKLRFFASLWAGEWSFFFFCNPISISNHTQSMTSPLYSFTSNYHHQPGLPLMSLRCVFFSIFLSLFSLLLLLLLLMNSITNTMIFPVHTRTPFPFAKLRSISVSSLTFNSHWN